MKPAAVLRQAKAAEQLVKDLNANPGNAAALAAAAAAAPPAQPGQPAPLVPDNLPNVGDTPPPGAAPVQGAPAADPGQPPAQPEDQRYKVLKGKYDAEVPRLLEALNETRQQVDQLMRVNQNLQAQLQQPPAPPARREETFQSLVTDKERESFGEDLIDVVGRRAQEAVLPAVRQMLQSELQPLKQMVGQTAQVQASIGQQGVYAALNARIPDWEIINNSVQFLAWLEAQDVFSGLSRRNALTAAFNSNDAPRVVGIFEAFKREDASTGSTSAPPRQPAVAAETLIAPGQPRGGSTEAAPGSSRGKIWSEGEIREFYDRVRRKRVTPEEYKQTSAEIALAAQNGWIKPDRMDSHLNQR